MSQVLPFQSAADVARFALGGNAILTLTSRKTGAYYTLSLQRSDDGGKDRPVFVKLLTGPDNGSDYTYLGTYAPASRRFRLTRASRLPEDATPVKVARLLCEEVVGAGRWGSQLEVRHAGRCGKCKRRLTTPESLDRGIGPECWQQLGLAA